MPKPVHQPAAEFCSSSTLPKDPVLRREKLQDLMTQIQGTYNFMQVCFYLLLLHKTPVPTGLGKTELMMCVGTE